MSADAAAGVGDAHTAETDSRQYARQRRGYWARRSAEDARGRWARRAYQRRLQEVYRAVIPPGSSVLELGSGDGDLLASLKDANVIGVDFTEEVVQRARERHPSVTFVCGDAHSLPFRGVTFDYVILSDLLNDVWDVQGVLEEIRRVSTRRTRVIINAYSRLWQPILTAARALGVAAAVLPQNWLTVDDLRGLLAITKFDAVRTWQEVLWPLPVPLVAGFCNRVLVRVSPFRLFALSNFVVARVSHPVPASATVSVIVPARNEAGNIAELLRRLPEMGSGTEVIFVEGHSLDRTYETIAAEIAKSPVRPCRLLRQNGHGKGDAVRAGFAVATGDVLMILDADLSVAPEELPRFLAVLTSGTAELVNGVRLVYPMERHAMAFSNLIGNKAFSYAFSWLLGQPVKDTLCGTKVLWRADYERIVSNRLKFGDFDPFGDFDLLFGAGNLSLRILDLPVRYRERRYGRTNIQRWRHGLLLLRMVVFGSRKLKFV